jgi:hypothetical protein
VAKPAVKARPAARKRPPWMNRVLGTAIVVMAALLLIIGSFEFGSRVLYKKKPASEARPKSPVPVQVAATPAPEVKTPPPVPAIEKKPPTPTPPAPVTPPTPPPTEKTPPKEAPKMEPKPPEPEAKMTPKPEPKPEPTPAPPEKPVVKPPPTPPKDEPKPVQQVLTYEQHVLPIFTKRCLNCHGAGSIRGGLDLRTLAAVREGGVNGTSIKPGSPQESILWMRIADNSMPTGKNKLSAMEKKLIQDWILGGAKGRTGNARAQAAKP